MTPLTVGLKKIKTKMEALEWSQHFPHYTSMQIFSDAQRQLTPWFDLAQFRALPRCHGCPNYTHEEKEHIKNTHKKHTQKQTNKGAKVTTTFFNYNYIVAFCCYGNQSSDFRGIHV